MLRDAELHSLARADVATLPEISTDMIYPLSIFNGLGEAWAHLARS
jgi:hypothetical protein